MGLENNVTSVLLETVCGPASTLPHNKRPEIALAGRSNVGKSSLINGLYNRKSYAGHHQSQERHRQLIIIL